MMYAPPLPTPWHPPAYEPVNRRPGLLALSDGVRVALKARGLDTVVTVTGWKELQQQINQGPKGANRVSFMPGLASGDGGRLDGDTMPTRHDQVIASDEHFGTVSIWQVDTTALASDEAQYTAWYALFQETVRAMHIAVDPMTGAIVGAANLKFGKYSFTKPPTNVAFGLEARLEFTQYAPVISPSLAIARPQPVIEETP